MADHGNLFAAMPRQALPEEIVLQLAATSDLRIERIVSTGQASPVDYWYDQERNEWVMLLRGAARLRFEGEAEARALAPGDYVNIPAHRRHRGEWTDPDQVSVWLAVHYR